MLPCCIFAGHETTATTTAAALYCVSAHPAVEAQLQAELQSVLGDRPPTYADLEHLPYLQVGTISIQGFNIPLRYLYLSSTACSHAYMLYSLPSALLVG